MGVSEPREYCQELQLVPDHAKLPVSNKTCTSGNRK